MEKKIDHIAVHWFKDRIIDPPIQDENLDVNFDRREMLIYEHIDKQLARESFPANYKREEVINHSPSWEKRTYNTNELI